MRIDLSGKVVLVTGSGQGAGRAITLTLAEAGAVVALNDINGPASEDAAAIRAARRAPTPPTSPTTPP